MNQLRREPEKLTRGRFDLVVIGGGINGAAVAWDAATRGLKTALIERRDFGSGSSSGNFKTLHGGLRYLQHLDLSRLWESVAEQAFFLRAAPHLTQPMPFLVPCYGRGMKSKEALRVASLVYEFLATQRNSGVSFSRRLEKHSMLSPEELRRRAPYVAKNGLRGALQFWDAQITHADRMTLLFVLSAVRAGATICNYVAAEGSIRADSGAIEKVICRDEMIGKEFAIETRGVINACGPWSELVAEKMLRRVMPDASQPLFSKGLQLVLKDKLLEQALAVESAHGDATSVVARGNRSYFLLPWRERTIVGTADIVHAESPSTYSLKWEEAQTFLKEVSSAYPDSRITESNVSLVFGGLRPVEPSVRKRFFSKELNSYGSVEAAHRDLILDHSESDTVSNFISVIGIKYTTVRSVAEKAVDLFEKKLRGAVSVSMTSDLKLAGSEYHDVDRYVGEKMFELEKLLPPAFARQLILDYGTGVESLITILRQNPASSRMLTPELCAAQVYHAIHNEMAVTLSDVVLRRTSAGSVRVCSKEELEAIAAIAAVELSWGASRIEAEVEEGISSSVFHGRK